MNPQHLLLGQSNIHLQVSLLRRHIAICSPSNQGGAETVQQELYRACMRQLEYDDHREDQIGIVVAVRHISKEAAV